MSLRIFQGSSNADARDVDDHIDDAKTIDEAEAVSFFLFSLPMFGQVHTPGIDDI